MVMKVALTVACLWLAKASALVVHYPASPGECFRPTAETAYLTNLPVSEDFEVSFTWLPNDSFLRTYNEIFRITADPYLTNSVNTRNLLLRTYSADPSRIQMTVAYLACLSDPVDTSVQDIRVRVQDDQASFYINNVLECEFTLASPNSAVTGVLMTSKYYPAAVGQVCGLSIDLSL